MKKIKKRRGASYYELIIIVILTVSLIMTMINIYGAFIKYQNVKYTNRRITRNIEIEGAYNSNTENLFNELKNEYNLDGATFTVSEVAYFKNSDKTIQLRDTFKVTIDYMYEFDFFNGELGVPVTINIPMKSNLVGVSEVYWK